MVEGVVYSCWSWRGDVVAVLCVVVVVAVAVVVVVLGE